MFADSDGTDAQEWSLIRIDRETWQLGRGKVAIPDDVIVQGVFNHVRYFNIALWGLIGEDLLIRKWLDCNSFRITSELASRESNFTRTNLSCIIFCSLGEIFIARPILPLGLLCAIYVMSIYWCWLLVEKFNFYT